MGNVRDNMDKDKKDNVVQYPNLNKVLLEKGTNMMMNKKYKDALALFDQLIDLEEKQVDALIGSVVCCIELGQLKEAKTRCKNILLLGLGDYYDILNIYLSILMQLEEYQEITNTIEALFSEHDVPHSYEESFEQILSIAKKMVSEHSNKDRERNHLGVEKSTIEKLQDNNNPELQWAVIQELNHLDDEVVIEIFKSFVEKKENDPVLKSFVLQMLHGKGCKDTVKIDKFGKSLEVNMNDLQDVFQLSFPHQVIAALKEVIEHKNPSLYEQTTQLWWHYLLVIYPFIPSGKEVNNWAAGLHAAANELNGIPHDNMLIAKAYGIKAEEVTIFCDKILEMEKYSIKGMKF
jgi:tetratricopeptide (TPR) repeat protein